MNYLKLQKINQIGIYFNLYNLVIQILTLIYLYCFTISIKEDFYYNSAILLFLFIAIAEFFFSKKKVNHLFIVCKIAFISVMCIFNSHHTPFLFINYISFLFSINPNINPHYFRENKKLFILLLIDFGILFILFDDSIFSIANIIFFQFSVLSLAINSISNDEKFKTNVTFLEGLRNYLRLFKVPYSFFFLVFSANLIVHFKIELILITLVLPYIFEVLSEAIRKFKFDNGKIHFKIYENIKVPSLYAITIILIYWLNVMKYDSNHDQNIQTSLNYLINISIFNVASFFIILQLNYNKFGSTVLIKILSTNFFLLFLASFPTDLILISLTLDYLKITVYNLPISNILFSLLSSLLLITYFRNSLEINTTLSNIFNVINTKDFINYKKNIINRNESKIDAILKISSNIILKNDTASGHAFFHHLAYWIKDNIEHIGRVQSNYYEYENNKFVDFFETIIMNLSISNNYLIQRYYIDSLRNLTMNGISSETFQNYSLIYQSLFRYLILSLQEKREDISISIYNLIYRNSAEILLALPKVILENHSQDISIESFEEFKKIFCDKIRHVINTAIEFKCTYFLRSMNYYSDLFLIHKEKEKSYGAWDGKIFNIYIETRFDIEEKNKYLLKENQNPFYFNDDFIIFDYYFPLRIRYTYQIQDQIQNFVSESLMQTYIYAIENNKIKTDWDLKIFWDQFIPCIKAKDIVGFSKLFNFYTFLLNLMFTKEFKTKSPNLNLIHSVWNTIILLKNNEIIKNKNNKEFKIHLDRKYKFFHSKFPKLKKIEKIKIQYRFIKDLDLIKKYEVLRK
ncbi:hypothetical protein [Leptospira bandrabouensis]|uniref:hypothetical protein n=1 Tax=Leptospira bandrabouensis TaxID=2484903 RepID=UPI001EE9CBF8|nr:hypothetical protein [Leptospira bandrabouensis]MCG6146474.1 hypothetical protein [Leptospira bandrabouensis]MCG6166103.1 hypothetical protein [Leptospira bandrabouensis]